MDGRGWKVAHQVVEEWMVGGKVAHQVVEECQGVDGRGLD